MRRSVKYIIWVLAIALTIFLSLDIQKLDEFKMAHTSEAFDVEHYADDIWENDIPVVSREAPDIARVAEMWERNPRDAYETYGRKLGISNTWYFMAKGTGIIESVEEEFILVRVDSLPEVELATGFIFGNEVRDGTGVVDIDEFVNMTDFNNVSIALNNRVKREVVPELVSSAAPGKGVEFAGAFAIVENQIRISPIRMVPLQIKITDGTGE